MTRDHKGKLHFPLAIHRTAAQVKAEVKSKLIHKSHRRSKSGKQQQPTHLCHHGDVQTVLSELSREHSIGSAYCEGSSRRCPGWVTVHRALHCSLPSGHD